jgi:FkbM family methyltransferase
VLARTLYPFFRRVDFRGKGRLRRVLPVPSRGVVEAGFPDGMRLRLDLRESLQRDFFFGLYDRAELRLVREWLREGGDFVDVGAHIGLYTVFAARYAERVLAIEPNAPALRQLEENVRLNGLGNVLVCAAAASASAGEAELAVAASDPAFSTLGDADFEAERIRVPTTTVDAEVERHGLAPALVKIDVQDHELEVLAGMEQTLAQRPAVLCEVGEATAAAIVARLSGWRAYRVGTRGLREELGDVRGYFNALFVADEIR